MTPALGSPWERPVSTLPEKTLARYIWFRHYNRESMERPPPENIAILMDRAQAIAGRQLAWLAARLELPVPADLRRSKGWIGQLLEAELGATGGSKAQHDFPQLGVELKTLPVSPTGKVRESTYVCTAPLDGSMSANWADCWVRRKLSQVLWIPIVGDARTPPGERVVGNPLLWRPEPEEDTLLRKDWEALNEMISLGELWQLDARKGVVLQLRPKAAHGSEMTWMLDDQAEWVQANPRGFYLRTRFTQALVDRSYAATTP
jgi:DNA mismatch repair protein MutH